MVVFSKQHMDSDYSTTKQRDNTFFKQKVRHENLLLLPLHNNKYNRPTPNAVRMVRGVCAGDIDNTYIIRIVPSQLFFYLDSRITAAMAARAHMRSHVVLLQLTICACRS
jgi:hypothetical protein